MSVLSSFYMGLIITPIRYQNISCSEANIKGDRGTEAPNNAIQRKEWKIHSTDGVRGGTVLISLTLLCLNITHICNANVEHILVNKESTTFYKLFVCRDHLKYYASHVNKSFFDTMNVFETNQAHHH